jgi:hypothetical protein
MYAYVYGENGTGENGTGENGTQSPPSPLPYTSVKKRPTLVSKETYENGTQSPPSPLHPSIIETPCSPPKEVIFF